MKYIDIMKELSQIVAEKLNEHCLLTTEHMCGHQGEIAKFDYIDLAARSARPNHMYRILLTNDKEYVNEAYRVGQIDKIVLSILYYDDVSSNKTVWNNEGKVVFKKSYYKIGEDFYTVSYQKAKEAVNLKLSRRRLSDYDEDIIEPADEDKFNTVATDYVKRNVYKFAKEVVVKKVKGGYFVRYNKMNGDKIVTHIYLAK